MELLEILTSWYVLRFCGSLSNAKSDSEGQATSWSDQDSAKVDYETVAIKVNFTPCFN